MSNSILPRRGDEANRQNSSNLLPNEVHVSKNNPGEGADTRMFVRGDNQTDTLIGPYEFVAGDRISLSTNTNTGVVTISYQDAATYSPSMSLARSAIGYGSASTIEVGDVFSGTQTISVANGNGANEVSMDQVTWSYSSQGSAVNGTFNAPLDQLDGITASSGTDTISGTISAPSGFRLGDNNSRRVTLSAVIRADQDSSFGSVTRTQNWNWGWRLVPFMLPVLYDENTIGSVTASDIKNNAMFTLNNSGVPTTTRYTSQVQNTPTNFPNFGITLPNSPAQFYYPYIAFNVEVPEPGTNSYEWEPNGVLLLPTSPLNFTEVAGPNTFPWQGTLGPQTGNAPKNYAIYRFGSASGFSAQGQTLTFQLT